MGPLVRAADDAQEDGNDGDDQQCMDDAAGVIAEIADGPEDDQDHGDDVE